MSRPVAGLDRAECRILKRLNAGSQELDPALNNRIKKLRESGFVEDTRFGGVAITLRGQLELARWRFRKIPRSQYAIMGPASGKAVFGKFFRQT